MAAYTGLLLSLALPTGHLAHAVHSMVVRVRRGDKGRDNDSCIFEPFGTFTRIRQLECGRAKRHGGGFAREIPLYGQQQTA